MWEFTYWGFKMTRDWRKHIHPDLREHLEMQIRNTFTHKKGYESADNRGNAQLWVAIGNLSKQLSKIEKRLQEIEGVTKEAGKDFEKDFSLNKQEEVSFIETPLMGQLDELKDIKLPELDEIRELVSKGDALNEALSKKASKKRIAVKKNLFSLENKRALGNKETKGKKLLAVKKTSAKKTLKKSLRRF